MNIKINKFGKAVIGGSAEGTTPKGRRGSSRVTPLNKGALLWSAGSAPGAGNAPGSNLGPGILSLGKPPHQHADILVSENGGENMDLHDIEKEFHEFVDFFKPA